MQSKRKLSWRGWIVLLLIVIGVSVIVAFIYNASSSLSDKDFTDIEKRMQSVYVNMKLSEAKTEKVCYEYKDSMSSVLKCQVEMAAFINFSNRNDIQQIVTDYERSLHILSTEGFTLQKSLRDTGAIIWSGSFTPNDSKLPMGCSAKVVAQGEKISIGRALGEHDLTDKAALVLQCGGKSREAYFTHTK